MNFQPRKLISENKGFLFFIFVMIFVRSAIADWYTVPTSSMYPHLIQGDRVFAFRLAYDIKVPFTDIILKQVGEPERGDIVTFTSPVEDIRLIKRVIGLPGDVLEMRNDVLIINGVAAEYSVVNDEKHFTPVHEYADKQLIFTESFGTMKHKILNMPDRASQRSFDPIRVPSGHYFMMGDSRDNSNDSRYYGMVKRELLTGRVKNLMFSLDYENYYMPRLERTGAKVTP